MQLVSRNMKLQLHATNCVKPVLLFFCVRTANEVYALVLCWRIGGLEVKPRILDFGERLISLRSHLSHYMLIPLTPSGYFMYHQV
jgi:hypothetical protein